MQIDANRKLLTLVVVIDVDSDVIEDRIHTILEQARGYSTRPGFVSCCIHRSIDGSRIVEYIQWESMAHLQAVASDVNDVHPAGFATSIDVLVLDVVDVIEPAMIETPDRQPKRESTPHDDRSTKPATP